MRIHSLVTSRNLPDYCPAIDVSQHIHKNMINSFKIARSNHQPSACWRHQMETFSALLAICAGNSPAPVNFPHKGQWHGALMFSLICVWINDRVNNREAGDLRRYHSHYDVIVMYWKYSRMTRSVPLLHMTWLLTSPVHQQSWYLLTWRMTWSLSSMKEDFFMMTSSNGNIFRVTGHLCGEFTGPRWIPHTKASDAQLWCLLWSASE